MIESGRKEAARGWLLDLGADSAALDGVLERIAEGEMSAAAAADALGLDSRYGGLYSVADALWEAA